MVKLLVFQLFKFFGKFPPTFECGLPVFLVFYSFWVYLRSFTLVASVVSRYTQAITRAGLIRYHDISGCYILLPPSMHIWITIQRFMDKDIEARGVKPCMFPLFVSKVSFFLSSPPVSSVLLWGFSTRFECVIVRVPHSFRVCYYESSPPVSSVLLWEFSTRFECVFSQLSSVKRNMSRGFPPRWPGSHVLDKVNSRSLLRLGNLPHPFRV
jgi:hypothetical protein